MARGRRARAASRVGHRHRARAAGDRCPRIADRHRPRLLARAGRLRSPGVETACEAETRRHAMGDRRQQEQKWDPSGWRAPALVPADSRRGGRDRWLRAGGREPTVDRAPRAAVADARMAQRSRSRGWIGSSTRMRRRRSRSWADRRASRPATWHGFATTKPLRWRRSSGRPAGSLRFAAPMAASHAPRLSSGCRTPRCPSGSLAERCLRDALRRVTAGGIGGAGFHEHDSDSLDTVK